MLLCGGEAGDEGVLDDGDVVGRDLVLGVGVGDVVQRVAVEVLEQVVDGSGRLLVRQVGVLGERVDELGAEFFVAEILGALAAGGADEAESDDGGDGEGAG